MRLVQMAVMAGALALVHTPYIGRAQAVDEDPCRDRGGYDHEMYRHCEVREQSLPPGSLTVSAGPNGGVRVHAWDRSEIRIRAVVRAAAPDEARARELVSEIEVQTAGHRVYARGPQSGRREWWSVGYLVDVPRKNDLDLSAANGGITIDGVAGTVRFQTTNGGVRLSDLAGSVRGSTKNGGLRVSLSGRQWEGEGLDVETTNGGVTLSIPEGYNARLETGTVNGSLRTDYPLTITGELNYRRGISTTLGSGGPLLRIRTVNGGLRINRRQD